MARCDDIEITRELMEAVAIGQLYREEISTVLRKALPGKLTQDDIQTIYKRVLSHPDFKTIKDEAVKLEELTLIDDNVDTIALYYNKLLKEAQFEKKYEVVIRILKEIQNLKAIENSESKFEVVIRIEKNDE
ncbi:MAG: hypothetical protein NC218_08175 [Acetobacter sp.]|nr:hypothetical protein [Acetobacter sp.]